MSFRIQYMPAEAIDDALIVVALFLMRDMLFMSKYPPEVQRALRTRIDDILEYLNGVRPDKVKTTVDV